jgi:nucleoside-diphosphate-sugar epimerase
MSLPHFIGARIKRGFTLATIGPNEARIFFDAVVSGIASLLAILFWRLFVAPGHLTPGDAVLAFELPLFFVLINIIFGLYARLRTSHARIKAVVLGASVLLSAGTSLALSRNVAVVVLWVLLVTGPVVLARLLIGIHSDRHRTIAAIVINRRGPVLVLGGAGYIGSHTVEQLLRRGHEVRVLDRLMYGEHSLAEFRTNPSFSLIEGDVTDISKLTSAMKGCSSVVHLAGLVGDPACAVSPEFTRHTNCIATRMAREVAEAMGIYRFIFASSCSVYGVSDTEVSESAVLNPVSLYAQTKIDSERELLSIVRDEFFVTVLRFATVFGHSRRPRFDLVANLFTAQAMTDGRITVIGPHQWRPFIHVRDLARAIAAALEADPRLTQSQIFNVGDRRLNMTILQLAERVRDIVSKYRPVEISVTDNPSDRRNYAVSFEKIGAMLGFHAETSIEHGIEELVRHFLNSDYRHYRSPEYSNVVMTTKALAVFEDPSQMSHLYAPLHV